MTNPEYKTCSCPKGGRYDDGSLCDKCGGTEWIEQPPNEQKEWWVEPPWRLGARMSEWLRSDVDADDCIREDIIPIITEARARAIEECKNEIKDYFYGMIAALDAQKSCEAILNRLEEMKK